MIQREHKTTGDDRLSKLWDGQNHTINLDDEEGGVKEIYTYYFAMYTKRKRMNNISGVRGESQMLVLSKTH